MRLGKLVGFLLLGASVAQANGSGLGLSIYRPEDTFPVLLDFVRYNPNYFEDVSEGDGSKLTVTPFANTYGFAEIQNLQALPAYNYAISRLAAWEKNSPALTSAIRIALTGIHWYVTPYEPIVKAAPADVAPITKEILGTVVEDPQTFRMRISISVWNKHKTVSQAGILVHEALRMIQNSEQPTMTDQKVMELTARILLESPKENETFDDKSAYAPRGAMVRYIEAIAATPKRNETVIATLEKIEKSFSAQESRLRDLFKTARQHVVENPRLEFTSAQVQELENAMRTARSPKRTAADWTTFVRAQNQHLRGSYAPQYPTYYRSVFGSLMSEADVRQFLSGNAVTLATHNIYRDVDARLSAIKKADAARVSAGELRWVLDPSQPKPKRGPSLSVRSTSTGYP
ncbi:MAG: hypothetical protein AB7F66_16575 [Bacteriovoracia bacterium]